MNKLAAVEYYDESDNALFKLSGNVELSFLSKHLMLLHL